MNVQGASVDCSHRRYLSGPWIFLGTCVYAYVGVEMEQFGRLINNRRLWPFPTVDMRGCGCSPGSGSMDAITEHLTFWSLVSYIDSYKTFHVGEVRSKSEAGF